MRNLRTFLYSQGSLTPNGGFPRQAVTWDVITDTVTFASHRPDTDSILLERVPCRPDDSGKSQPSTVISQIPASLPDDEVIDVRRLVDESAFCLVMKGGDIILIRDDPLPGESPVELVGTVDGGIQAASWSPDDDVLVLVTHQTDAPTPEDGSAPRLSAIFMTRDFDPLATTPFKIEDKNASKHVNVGWGKAETQFRGKRAKALLDPTIPEKIDQGLATESDDGRITLSWRGDGAYVAINSVEESRGGRMIRVYSREGELDSVSEPVDGLESAVSWRPSGNLIAGIKRSNGSAEVVLFERNGLRHGEFALRGDWNGPVHLKWNSDSTALAVIGDGKIQIWTMGNYHYYLKQEFKVSEPAGADTLLAWHPERPLELAYADRSSDSFFYRQLGRVVNSGIRGSTFVTDGSLLKYTPLALANVPPPMSLLDLKLQDNIVDVAVSSDELSVAVLMPSLVRVLGIDGRKLTNPTDHKLPSGFVPRQVATATDLVLVLGQDQQTLAPVLFNCSTQTAVECSSAPVSVFGILGDCSSLLIQTITGSVHRASHDTTGEALVRFPGITPSVSALAQAEGNVLVAGQNTDGVLYVNGVKVMSNCTSFVLTKSHLMATDARNVLRFGHVSQNASDPVVIPESEAGTDERCRNVERGAKLVTAIPSSSSVILQMPRGNLETIFPRALVLASIRRHISAKDYGTAMKECRAQRVDMNMLYDYDPAQFRKEVRLFAQQVGAKEADLDLFLSQLRDEDVCQTMYRDTLQGDRSLPTAILGPTEGEESKVNFICSSISNILLEDESRYRNRISACVCMSPPALEAGLEIVAGFMKTNPEVAENAAEHICFLADPNALYQASLGMYNLPLTILIAQQAQRDPREYIPFLQSLEEMSDVERKYSIDDYLQRHEQAVRHLFTEGNFDRVCDYVEKHALYSTALLEYRYEPERLARIVRLHAGHLAAAHKYREAAIAYESVGDYDDALAMYRHSPDNWKETLAVATLIPLPGPAVSALADALVEALTTVGDHRAAATIRLDYLDDVAGALDSLCEAHRFGEAVRLAGLRRRPDLLDTVVDPGLADGFARLTDVVADCRKQLAAQIGRVRELRAKKAADPLAFLEGTAAAGGGDGDGDVPDNVSIASSRASTTGTFMTQYTGRTLGGQTGNTATSRRTSKNRRREERKRQRGKKGTVYEEEYLVGSLRRLVSRVNQATEEVRVLQEGLVRRRMAERARVLGAGMVELVRLCEQVGDVFREGQEEQQQEPQPRPEHLAGDDEPVLSAGERVLQESISAMSKNLEPPTVKKFETLTLVDY